MGSSGSPAIGIRWPNDIEAGGRKLGGSCPNAWRRRTGDVSSGRHRSERGNHLSSAPVEVRTMATSLAAFHAQTARRVTIFARLLAAILGQFESSCHVLAVERPSVSHQWGHSTSSVKGGLCRPRHHCVAGWGQGIDHEGALCLHDGRNLRGSSVDK